MLAWLLDAIMLQMSIAKVPIEERVWQHAAEATRGFWEYPMIFTALMELLADCQELTVLMIGTQPSSTCVSGKASQAHREIL